MTFPLKGRNNRKPDGITGTVLDRLRATARTIDTVFTTKQPSRLQQTIRSKKALALIGGIGGLFWLLSGPETIDGTQPVGYEG